MWSTELELQRKIEMEQSNSEADRTSSKRHIKMWVTDAVAMSNVHKMALATTNRDVYFYDMSTPIYTPQFRLCGKLYSHCGFLFIMFLYSCHV